MKASRFLWPLLLLVAIWMFAGCAWFGAERPEKPASELVREGVAAYDRGKYTDALKAFEQLKNWYPFSQYAILAELKIADSHYHLQQYPEAVAAYEEFERLHPRNEAVPYVIYQIGRCHYEQIDSVDRDQSSARKALDTFRRLVRQFPNDPYARKADSHIIICLQSLAGHEMHVGHYYFRQAQYQAARHRFLAVITQYPDVGYHHEALHYLTRCEAYRPLDTSSAEGDGVADKAKNNFTD